MVQYVLKRVNIQGRIAFEPPKDQAAQAPNFDNMTPAEPTGEKSGEGFEIY